MRFREVFYVENRSRLELYVGFVGGRLPAKRGLTGKERPRELSDWSADHDLRIAALGPVPVPYLDVFLKGFVEHFQRAGFRLVGLPRAGAARRRASSR